MVSVYLRRPYCQFKFVYRQLTVTPTPPHKLTKFCIINIIGEIELTMSTDDIEFMKQANKCYCMLFIHNPIRRTFCLKDYQWKRTTTIVRYVQCLFCCFCKTIRGYPHTMWIICVYFTDEKGINTHAATAPNGTYTPRGSERGRKQTIPTIADNGVYHFKLCTVLYNRILFLSGRSDTFGNMYLCVCVCMPKMI